VTIVVMLGKSIFDNEPGRKGICRLPTPDKCSQAIEGEGGELPMERKIWRVELELCRQNLEAAHNAAKYVSTRRPCYG
jgi:hypothetical protein